MGLVTHALANFVCKLSDCLAKVRLIPHIFVRHAILVFGVRKWELLDVPEIDKESCLLILDHVFCLVSVVVDVFSIDRVTRVLLVIRII